MKKLTYKYFLHKIKVVTWASFIIRKLLNGKVVHMTKLSQDRVITWQSCPMNFQKLALKEVSHEQYVTN